MGKLGGLAVDPDGSVYCTDPHNHIVFRVARDGLLKVVAGCGLFGSSAMADRPPGL